MLRRTRRRWRGAGPSSLLFGELLGPCLVIKLVTLLGALFPLLRLRGGRGVLRRAVVFLKHARLREWVLGHSWDNLGDQINSLFDVFLLARLIVAGRRSGPLAALRRVLGSKDLTRVIAKFLVLKLEPGQG